MKKPREYSAFFEGISDFPKTGGAASYQKGRSVDHRTDTRSISLQPRTIKESGSVVTDLIKWAVTPPPTGDKTYMYGENGNFYQRTQAGAYSLLRTIANSHGNGLGWFGEDNFVYYTRDALIGRYGPVGATTPTFKDDFFGSQGGNPTNTASLQLNGTTQYASRASTASLQVAGDLAISAQINPSALPTVGNSFTIASKWTENGNLRSYKFDIAPVANYFGDGSDGALTISADTTEAPIDSACTGTINTNALTATNISFAPDQIILIHQTQGTGAGTWERNKIQSYTAGTITTVNKLAATYGTGAQVRVLKQYSTVTINSAKTYTAKAWNGTTGGILAFLCSGTLTVTGSMVANGAMAGSASGATGGGFRGGNGVATNSNSQYGEGTTGVAATSGSGAANGNGGGGAYANSVLGSGQNADGGGGGNGTAGGNGAAGGASIYNGTGGSSAGSADLTTIVFGGGGGGGASDNGSAPSNGGGGGSGGGILFPSAVTITVTGTMSANGGNSTGVYGIGGAGAGGSILLKAQTATLGGAIITANGGTSTGANSGGAGRIHIDYLTSYTGTTSPTINATQDPSLASSSGQTLRLQISSTGTNVETYSMPAALTTSTWQQVGVSWKASTSTASFYLNGILLGTQIGALTAINANASVFNVGIYKDGAGAAAGFYNGIIDEVQVFSVTRTIGDFILSLQSSILATTTGLAAYYQFESVATDSTANANDLTLTGSPSYSSLVPFSGSSTRLNLDQSQALAGNTYTTPVAISESATNRFTFTPTKDPQLSVAVTIAAKGTGNWTLTIHDQFNNVVASVTVLNANLAVGSYEFIFATPWRILIGSTYHAHITSTVADGTIQTGTAADLTTANYSTYFAFLVSDTQWHPVSSFLQFLVFGNERYVGKLEATLYDPNKITLPAGWKVRCFAYWNEYLAIGAWQGNTIDQYDKGRIFFWDGASITYNFFIDVPEGGINAMIGTKGKLFFMAGSRAKLLVYEGGAQARKIKNLINTDNAAVIDIYPGAMSMWRTLMRIGCAGNNQDMSVQEGVYTYGSVNDKYPDSLSFDFPISTGTYQSTSVRIGMVTTVDGKLLIGWNDNTAYGVDYVSIANPPYPTGTVEFLIEDDDAMYHQKEMVTLTGQFEPLLSGESMQFKYRLNRSGTWIEFPAVTKVGETTFRKVISLNGSRYREYELGANLATSTTTSPALLAESIEPDQLVEEKRVG